MQRTNICYVITKSNFGGAQKYVFELATSLPQDQFAVTVALGGNGPLKTKLEEKGITTITIPHLERNISFIKELRVFSFLYHVFNDNHFDVVHLNSSKIGGIGGVAARLAGIPRIIFTAHGFAFNEARSTLSKMLIKLSYWVTMLLADKTIAVSRAIKEQVHGWPFLHRRIVVIQNGIKPFTLLEKSAARTALAEQFPSLSIHKHWVGTLAELHPIKGLDIYIDAIAALGEMAHSFQFVVMGEGEVRAQLEAQIKKHDLEDTILLVGYVAQATQYLQAFDVFVLPSRSEALALAVLEAGYAKLPVIASHVGGLPEVITDNVSGILVPKEDVSALSKALKRALEPQTETAAFGIKLSEHVEKHFMHDQMLTATTALYTQS